jgi:hypothetical protein
MMNDEPLSATPSARNAADGADSSQATWRLSPPCEQTGAFRLQYWPQGLPSGRFWGVLSSRLQRDLSFHRDWFRALRELDEELSPEVILVTAQTTTPFPFLLRLTARRPRRLVTIYPSPKKVDSLKSWCHYNQTLMLPIHEQVFPVFLSPPFSLPTSDRAKPPNSHQDSPPLHVPPLADHLIAPLVDQLVVLRLRKGGRLLAWIGELLPLNPRQANPGDRAHGNPMPLWLAVGPGLVAPRLAEALVERGAHWWRSFLVGKRPSVEAVSLVVQRYESEFGIPERYGHAPHMELPDPLHSTGGRSLARPE